MTDFGRPSWEPPQIFVFGSNLAGIHGAGAALFAKERCGARYGAGIGIMGRSYAIPTKDWKIETMELEHINHHVKVFLDFATAFDAVEFYVTALGTGLAGYTHADIAPLFKGAPPNCIMPPEWKEYL